jgi:hypothetical protein
MLIERMIRAARLDPGVYNEVEQDQNANGQAVAVVLIVAVCAAIGGALSRQPERGLISACFGAVIVWLIWSLIVLIVGKLLGGTADFGEVMRTLAFARTPGVLYLFSFLPLLGGLAALAAWVWTWIATVVAIREAMDFDSGRAVLTVILPTVIVIILGCVLASTLAALGIVLFALGR